MEMLAKWLVPGDMVHISLGDRIPADVRLTEVGVAIIPPPPGYICDIYIYMVGFPFSVCPGRNQDKSNVLFRVVVVEYFVLEFLTLQG